MSEPLALAREALTGRTAWLVGGALRDRLLGRPVADLDLAVPEDAAGAARALARAARGPVFELSEKFGAWRVHAPDRSWQADFSPLRGDSLDEDLALRDFTINALAEPLAGGELVDPHGGERDLRDRRVRMVSEAAFDDDPLRVIRAARFACELRFEIDAPTVAAARTRAPRTREVAQERVYTELRRLVDADDAPRGMELLDAVGATDAVLPELTAMRGVEQTRYHHRDAYGHTIEVLDQAIALQRDPSELFGGRDGARVKELLDEPLADELTRGGALRWGALLHDAAKPQTQTPIERGGYGFPHHDKIGAELVRDVMTRLRASERIRAHVAALTRHHLRLGFLVHQRPLSRRDLYRYLTNCEPVEVDVTLLSVADRLATRGHKAQESIAPHLELAREVLAEALDWRGAGGAPAPLVGGDDLQRELGLRPGPDLGRVLDELREAQFAGDVSTRDEALELARSL